MHIRMDGGNGGKKRELPACQIHPGDTRKMSPVPRRQLQVQPAIATPVNNDNDLSHAFLTAEEAAEFLGRVNPRTLTRWAREGQIPAYPLGEGRRRLWRFRRADLFAWMQSRRRGPAPLADSRNWSRLFPATDAADQRTIQ